MYTFKRWILSYVNYLSIKNKLSQDGCVGRCWVSISPQLGHLLAAGGGPWPKEMGGTPKWTSRTWGDRVGGRIGGRTGLVPLRPGRSGEAGGRRYPGGAGEEWRAFAPPTQARGAYWAPSPVLCPPTLPFPPAAGHRKEAEGNSREAGGRGPLGGVAEEQRGIASPTRAQEACWAPRWGRPPSETRGEGHAWAPSVPWA